MPSSSLIDSKLRKRRGMLFMATLRTPHRNSLDTAANLLICTTCYSSAFSHCLSLCLQPASTLPEGKYKRVTLYLFILRDFSQGPVKVPNCGSSWPTGIGDALFQTSHFQKYCSLMQIYYLVFSSRIIALRLGTLRDNKFKVLLPATTFW